MHGVFSGKVIRGDQYGRTLGFPTANIASHDWHDLDPRPEPGIWAGYVRIHNDRNKYKATIVITYPVNDVDNPKLEAHILDWQDMLYGAILTFELMRYVRPYVTGKDEQELKKMIKNDIMIIQKYFGSQL